MDDADNQFLEYWRGNIGSFVVVDYISGDIQSCAKGKLESVSSRGDVIIKHVHNPHQSWSFNLFEVTLKNSKFSTLRGEDNDTPH